MNAVWRKCIQFYKRTDKPLLVICLVCSVISAYLLFGIYSAGFVRLKVVTTQIAELDLKGMVQSAEGDLKTMVQNVDSLVNTSQAGVQETLKKLNSIDFAKLNQAINDLSAVVEQLSRFFNVFR